ncbi:cullin, a subunit of E3 ubiquitin ligase [Mycolicibacterium aurum]|uniref:Cullin, a subunit of E3 ubiquitin ligase n=1 Tax=Mycolicibacterium aurum TaxID=1791 RepID=A0A3S4RSQ6_MYCAU|nr:type IV toxin-antitoxin system AbiEi family antitoxin [Mycolicibacterium aurum]VEG57621.1 cullin, a subunit of E3 ubiquitin ligase [Mycolicibacterium aurum]
MDYPFVGAEALSGGRITRGQLRWNYRAVLPGVYVPKDSEASVRINATAAWLWTARTGVIAGRAAAALHGAKWIDTQTPIDIIAEHTRPRSGIIVREERIGVDEITSVGGLCVTTPVRTALDLARHLPRDTAVCHLDALGRATGVRPDRVLELAARYRGARGIQRARQSLALMDSGAQSPRETRLRLMLVDDGLPPPRTQVLVTDGIAQAFIDMGYEEPKVGLDYDGSHHRLERRQYVHDIGRAEFIDRQGWIDIKVVAEHSRAFILHRVWEAFARRGWTPPRSA